MMMMIEDWESLIQASVSLIINAKSLKKMSEHLFIVFSLKSDAKSF